MVLRLVLFAGLVLHKLVWEVLKRKDGASAVDRQSSTRQPRTSLKLLKALVLCFLVTQTLFLNVLPILRRPNRLALFGAVIYLLGLSLALAGRMQLGRNWSDLEDSRVLPDQSLVTRGIYQYVRHPIYAGDVLLLAGLELALNSWLVLGVAAPALLAARQAFTEEAMLTEAFTEYNAYRKRTKMFIPLVV
jgi:protein-S-isoprenylcysteine O-methyltransferase Ste14